MELKQQVRKHWEDEVCGTRFAVSSDRQRFFDEISRARYAHERYIPGFADFAAYRGKRVLEIGVGAGSDFERWVQAGANATGIDLTEAAIALTRERLRLRGRPLASQRQVIYERLESPGTKAYANAEFTRLLEGIGFTVLSCRRELTAGDLLAMPPSQRHAGAGYRLLWRVYPRWLIRRIGRPLGLALLVHARKPGAAAPLS